jgi:hypothetical protein
VAAVPVAAPVRSSAPLRSSTSGGHAAPVAPLRSHTSGSRTSTPAPLRTRTSGAAGGGEHEHEGGDD